MSRLEIQSWGRDYYPRYDVLTIEIVIDMWMEKSNGDVKYRCVVEQAEFNKFEIYYDIMIYNHI